MSVEFELRKVSIRPIDVSALLKDWTNEMGVVGRLNQDGTGSAHFFIPGKSIRGFSLTRKWKRLRNRIELRLSVCASDDDWKAAYSFLRFGHNRGFKVQLTDGEVVRYGDLSPEIASEKAQKQFAADTSVLQHMLYSSDHEFLELPIDRFVVPVGRPDLPKEQLNSEIILTMQRVFQQRAAKYDAARSASLITLKTSETVIVWAGEALLAPTADYVVLSKLEFDAKTSVFQPWRDLVEKLSTGIEKIRQNPPLFYFEALPPDSAQWIELNKSGIPFERLGGLT